jgi:hypothetical protein
MEHVATVCREAGLDIMEHVFVVLAERETIPYTRLAALTVDEVTDYYYGFIQRSIDKVEASLLGEYDD